MNGTRSKRRLGDDRYLRGTLPQAAQQQTKEHLSRVFSWQFMGIDGFCSGRFMGFIETSWDLCGVVGTKYGIDRDL